MRKQFEINKGNNRRFPYIITKDYFFTDNVIEFYLTK